MKKSNSKNYIKTFSEHKKVLIALACIIVALPILSFAIFEGYYLNRVFPQVDIGGVQVSGMTRLEIENVLKKSTEKRLQEPVVLTLSTGQKIEMGKVGDIANYDVNKTIDLAFSHGREGNLVKQINSIANGFKYYTHINPVFSFDHQTFDTSLANAVRPFERPIIDSQLAFSNDQLYLSASQKGYLGNRDATVTALENYLSFRQNDLNLTMEMRDQLPAINESNSSEALKKAKLALARPLILKSSYLQGSSWTINKEQMFSLMDLNVTDKKVDLVFDDYKVASFSGQIAQQINRDPIEAKFELDGEKVKAFEPAEPGLSLDTVELTKIISERATNISLANEIEIPVKTTQPALSTANVNNYGIKELVGQGKSKFVGSPAGRIHNLALASSKLNGVLIAPGETFSMYKVVGEVEKSTGYQDAFIIKDGRTVPGVGGGLCQVSTTLFRAALNAGLPIVERHQHAYRVYYYEQDSAPGIDAAVYFPSWDFKFKNDTGNYLLLQTKVDTKKLTAEFNLYGVKDGRVVEISKPVVSNQAPPPPELRMDDPTLARGQEKEIDHAVWGADTVFNRTVTKDGQQIISDEFKSKYKPWQRVVMVGVKD